MHSLQLLDPQLYGIRDRLVLDARLGRTPLTLIEMILLIDCRERTTLGADARCEWVGNIHQPLLGKDGSAVGNETVALHLAYTQTTVARPAFAWLTSERHDGTTPAGMALVNHHVLEALVMGRANEDLHLHHFARLTVVHDLVAVRVQTQIQHVVLEIVQTQMGVRRTVTQRAAGRAHPTIHCFQQLRNRHARRNGVRVHNDIGTQSRSREGHITLIQNHAARTLLPSTGCKLVTDLWDTLGNHAHLHERVAVRVLVLPHPVNARRLSVLVGGREVAIRVTVGVAP